MFENTFLDKTAKAIVATAGIGGAFSANQSEAQGAILTNINQYNNSKALSTDPMYKFSAAVQRIDAANGVTHASAVMIAPDLFITAGHVTPRNDSTTAKLTQIILGENYNTSTERYAVASTQRYPGYVFGDTSTIDLGIGRLSSFVNGFNTPVTFANFSFGQTLTVSEYGNYGDIITGEQQSLGDRMAGRAKTTSASGIYPSGTYYSTFFEGPEASDHGQRISKSFPY